MSTSNEIGQTVAASAASAITTAKGVTYGGGLTSITGFLASNDGLATVGAVAALMGFVVNLYFGWREDRRKQREHEARMRDLDTRVGE